MNNINFINSLHNKFKEFNIESKVVEESLLIDVEAEDGVPAYKVAATFVKDNILVIYTSFYHNAVLKEEKKKLLVTLNNLNLTSVLKFTLMDKFIKVSYEINDLDESMVNYVVRNIALIPSMIAECYNDLKPLLK